MKEFYPYTIIPQKVEKIRQEGIPLPKLPKLLPMPEKARRKYLGTILFVVSTVGFIILNLLKSSKYVMWTYALFFVALISLVAMIFEFVQHGKLKKQYIKDMKHYQERKEAYKNVKAKQEKIEKENKNKEEVKDFQQKEIHEFFKTSYDTINAVHNEYSGAKKRFKLFLEEYFPDEVLDNIKVVHRTKKINYVPDYVIQFEKPKLNVAIEIEEPYSLSNVPENIQKDYEAKDRLRQRFANELGWIVIVLSEEQAVISPTECCKFIEDSIESIFANIKNGNQFVNIKPIKKQKMLTGEERAQLKKSKYREKYLIEAGLLDGAIGYSRKKDTDEKISKPEKKIEKKKLLEVNGVKKPEETTTVVENGKNIESESSKTINKMKTPLEKKKEIENEQMQLIKKIAKKAKSVADDNGKVEEEVKKEPIKFEKEEIEVPVEKKEVVENVVTNEKEDDSSSKKGTQLKREEEILKDLYSALDKHSKKRKEKEEVIAEVHKEEKSKVELKKEEPVKEKVERKSERKIKSAAEIILERKQQLQKEQNKKKETEIEKPEIKVEKVEIKTEDSNIKEKEEFTKKEVTVTSKFEEKEEETKIEEPEVKIEKEETKIEDSKIEEEPTKEEKEVLTEEVVTATNKAEKEGLGEEAIKNQEIIDAYREKIEGAVFDKQWDELIELCDKAINDLPYWDWAYYRRSTAWGHKREFPKVILDCNKAIGFNPTLADAYYNRGTARFFLGKYMDACDDYQKSVDLNYIKKADAYFNRGLCFQKLDHKKKAYREFLKAKEMGSQKAVEIIKNHYTE